MGRSFLTVVAAATCLICASASAYGRSYSSSTTHRRSSATVADAHKPVQHATTDPLALSVKLAERYWHHVPACGTPTIASAPHQLPDSDYEPVSGPEPENSVAEMWTEVRTCTITINMSVWGSWHQDDASFQWFCDAMTHEVGHLFGELDAGQTNPFSITYPLLSTTSPNLNSSPRVQERHAALRCRGNPRRSDHSPCDPALSPLASAGQALRFVRPSLRGAGAAARARFASALGSAFGGGGFFFFSGGGAAGRAAGRRGAGGFAARGRFP